MRVLDFWEVAEHKYITVIVKEFIFVTKIIHQILCITFSYRFFDQLLDAARMCYGKVYSLDHGLTEYLTNLHECNFNMPLSSFLLHFQAFDLPQHGRHAIIVI